MSLGKKNYFSFLGITKSVCLCLSLSFALNRTSSFVASLVPQHSLSLILIPYAIYVDFQRCRSL